MQAAVEQTVKTFGGLDICVNNASAISLTHAIATDMKRYDLMHGINARGTFLVSKTCIPHLKKAANPHILMLSPPLDMDPKWFAPHVAYAPQDNAEYAAAEMLRDGDTRDPEDPAVKYQGGPFVAEGYVKR